MTIKLFEAPVETAEPAPPLDAPLATRMVFAGLASLVAIIPALTTSYAAFRVMQMYAGIRNAETAGAEYITSSLHVFNTPLVISLGVSALLAFVSALVLAVDPKYRLASVGLPFSIAVPIIAAIPGLLLWSAETTTLDILSGRLNSGPVHEVAQRISLLVMGAIGWGLLAVAIAFACSIVSLILPVRRRTDADSLRRAFVWAVIGVLFLVFAGAYFVVV